jgi:histidine transport system substrate-binding protein
MKKLALSLSLALALSSVSTVFAAIPQKFVSVPIQLMPRSNRRMRRVNWLVLTSIWQKSCVSVSIRNVPSLKPAGCADPLFKSEENRRDYVFAVHYRKTPAGNCLHRQTVRGRFASGGEKGSDITPDLAKLKGKRVGVLQGTTQETYGNEHWAPKGIEIVSYQGQDNIYSDLTAGRIDAAFQDEVAASEGFLKQPVGKDYQFGGPSIKDESCLASAPVWGCVKKTTNCVKR